MARVFAFGLLIFHAACSLSVSEILSLSLRIDTNVESLGALSLLLLPRVRREILHTLLFAVPAL